MSFRIAHGGSLAYYRADMGFETAAIDLDGLILSIRNGTVVPVIGPELYVDEDGRPLERLIVTRLAAALGLSKPAADATPRRLALDYLRESRARPQTLRNTLRRIVDEVVQVPPAPLRQLAAIEGLRLYVTTTADAMLEQALTDARRPPIVRSYSPARTATPMPEIATSASPVVYHLLGSAATDTFPATDGDVLEYLYALSSPALQPKQLFDQLRERSLMFLGCGFPDWLLRFFIRTIKGTPFARDEPHLRIVADALAAADRELALFLQHYNHDLWLSPPVPAAAFVDTLHDAWMKRRPAPAPPGLPSGHEMPAGSVFLSFSNEDRATVEPIADELRRNGIDVWFDAHALAPGDEWDRLIQESLIRAVLVIPFISTQTERLAQEERSHYFWKEWRMADARAAYAPPGARYLLPVVLDAGIEPADAQVFDRFKAVQWYRLPERQATPEFVAFVVAEYRRKMLARRRT